MTPPPGNPTDRPNLGEHLRQEREKKGITVEQVASATKISVRMLHALEADQYGDLPAKPFIRGFVTSYAKFVGLDARQILTDYAQFIDQRSQDRPDREGGHSGYAFERKDVEQSRALLWGVMTTFIVIGAILVIIRPLRHRKAQHLDRLKSAPELVDPAPTPEATPAASSSPVDGAAPKATPTAAPKPTPTPTKTAVPPAPVTPLAPLAPPPSPVPSASAAAEDDPLNSGKQLKTAQIKHKVLMKALADLWVRYQCDERPLTRFMMRKGGILVLRAERGIKLQISNGESASFSYNSGGYKVFSKSTQFSVRNSTATVILPNSSSVEGDPFPGSAPLPATAPPAPEATSSPAPAGTPAPVSEPA
jgi:cytoskeleton protein RodZ